MPASEPELRADVVQVGFRGGARGAWLPLASAATQYRARSQYKTPPRSHACIATCPRANQYYATHRAPSYEVNAES
eukprot:889764-Rhodomonas_salina.2